MGHRASEEKQHVPFQRGIENAVKANRGMNNSERWTGLQSVVLSSAQKHVGLERETCENKETMGNKRCD